MDIKKLSTAAKPTKLAAYVAKLSKTHAGKHGHGAGHAESVREADHNGRHIVIRTTYEVRVNGKLMAIPLSVNDEGQLHCHALPNYQFVSALDAIKTLIDRFPDDFPKKAPRKRAAKKKKKPAARGHAAKHKHTRHAKKGGR